MLLVDSTYKNYNRSSSHQIAHQPCSLSKYTPSSPWLKECHFHPIFLTSSLCQTLRVVCARIRTRSPRNTNSSSRPPSPTTLSILRNHRASSSSHRGGRSCGGFRSRSCANLRGASGAGCWLSCYNDTGCRHSKKRRRIVLNRCANISLSGPNCRAWDGVVGEVRIDVHYISWFCSGDVTGNRHQRAGSSGSSSCDCELHALDIKLRYSGRIRVVYS
jgi:hypothetical protein